MELAGGVNTGQLKGQYRLVADEWPRTRFTGTGSHRCTGIARIRGILPTPCIAALCLTIFTPGTATGGPANPPKLAYATYLDARWGTNAIAADRDGNAYIGGVSPCRGSVLKLDPAGSTLLWSICVDADSITAVVLDGVGSLYAVGRTPAATAGYPTFTVFKLKADTGSTISSILVGGAYATALALDPEGNLYLTGFADASLQTTPGAYLSKGGGAFAMKINSSGAIQYATFLGAHGASAIAVDSKQNAWIVGAACVAQDNLLKYNRPICSVFPQATASTIIKLDARGAKTLVDKTFGGGTCCYIATPIPQSDAALGVAVDGLDTAWIVGKAPSGNVPTTPGAQRGNFIPSGQPHGYILHFSPLGDLLYGSYVGETEGEWIPSVALDAQNNVYFALSGTMVSGRCGYQYSSLVKVLSPDGAQVLASRYIRSPVQSLALDGRGGFYATGATSNTAFLTTPGAYQPFYQGGGGGWAFAVKLDFATAAGPEVTCVVNAASGNTGAITPGEIVTLTGSGFTPASVVKFGPYPAPILYSAATQINAVVPFEVTGSATMVSVDGGTASPNLPVAPAVPGLFTIPAQAPNGQAAALNEDGTLNSSANPAKAGAAVSVFMTGAGSMTPSLMDGQPGPTQAPYPAPILSVSAIIGPGCYPFSPLSSSCLLASVLFAGQAPGIVAGLVQVNLRIPEGAASGSNYLVVYVGGYSSYRVLIAVQ